MFRYYTVLPHLITKSREALTRPIIEAGSIAGQPGVNTDTKECFA